MYLPAVAAGVAVTVAVVAAAVVAVVVVAERWRSERTLQKLRVWWTQPSRTAEATRRCRGS